MTPVRVGDLTRRVVISVPTSVADTENPGCFIPGWESLGYRWAKLNPLSGRELMRAGKLTASGVMEVTIRYDKRVTPAARLTWEGRHFNITSVDDIEERHFYQRILCEEGVAQ